MAEKIISPGVFTNEIDQTFLPSAVADIGAALVGPTLKGPAGIPTTVTSFSDFQAKFGDVVTSGSDKVQFLTSHTAEQYLQNSDTLTVVRVMADGTGAVAPATAILGSTGSTTPATQATGSHLILPLGGRTAPFLTNVGDAVEITVGSTEFRFISFPPTSLPADESPLFFFSTGSVTGSSTETAGNGIFKGGAHNLIQKVNAAGIGVSMSFAQTATHGVLAYTASAAGIGGNRITVDTGSGGTGLGNARFGNTAGGTNSFLVGGANAGGSTVNSFTLRTIADGTIMNNADTTARTNNVLVSGSVHNIRYEVTNVNAKKGTFTLLIRAGNDNSKRKQTLESYTGINLDPNSSNYIGKAIGDQRQQVRTDGTTKYLELTGSFPNKSRFVTVEKITNTVDYLDET